MAKKKKFVSKTTTVKISTHIRDKVKKEAARQRRSVRAFVDHELDRAATPIDSTPDLTVNEF